MKLLAPTSAFIGVLAVAGGISLAHQQAPPASPSPAAALPSAEASSGSPLSLQVTSPVGLKVSTPPSNANPTVSAPAAIEIANQNGIRPDVQTTIKPVARLVIASTTFNQGADLTDALSNSLVWDVDYPDAPQEIHSPVDGPSKITGDPCDLHVLVNAITGVVIEGFQTGCSVH